MSRKLVLLLVVGLLLTIAVGTAAAYQDRGSIRGTVYKDDNHDGKCVGTGEGILADIPIKFVSDDGEFEVYLQSGSNGTYGLVAAGFGTWTVTAEPPSGYVVTSENPRKAFLGSDQLLVLGIDFCVAKGTAGAALPKSGASIAPVLAMVAVIGAGLMAAGSAIEWRRRQTM